MKAKTNLGSAAALTLVEVLVVIAVVVVLVGLLLPALAPQHHVKRIDCINNLKQLGLSFRIWAGDNGDRYPMQLSVTNGGTMESATRGAAWPHFQVLSNELNTPKVLVCPKDKPRVQALEKLMSVPTPYGSYELSFTGSCPVSYFVNVGAEASEPKMLLTGDDNLEVDGKRVRSGALDLWAKAPVGWTKERHGKMGNICLADGSVQQVSNAQLRQAIANTGVATNRLAMP
jgi:prepilin-type processing-associated H-X9-DG protein